MDIGTDLVGNGHNLINSGSSLIADTSAGFTANRIIDHLLIERGNAEKLLFLSIQSDKQKIKHSHFFFLFLYLLLLYFTLLRMLP